MSRVSLSQRCRLAAVASVALVLIGASTTAVVQAQAPASPSASQPAAAPAGDEDTLAQSIVEKADQIRFPTTGFEASIGIDTTTGGEAVAARKYKVLSKGNENTVVMVVEP